LLAANATLQRVRLVHDVNALRSACRPSRWAGVALAVAAWSAASWTHSHMRREPARQTSTAPVWALRGLTLWRAVRALRRVWRAQRSRH
jgi:hypothetical protein